MIRSLLIERATHDWQEVRTAAMKALGQLASALEIKALLIGWAKDADARVRFDAIEALGAQLGSDPEIKALLIAGAEDADATVRPAMIRALGAQLKSDPEIKALLAGWAKDADARVRFDAIEALGAQLGSDPEIKALLIAWTKDADARVRYAAIGALGIQLGIDPEIKRLLIAGATDADADVRKLVVEYWATEFGNLTTNRLLSRDLSGYGPWLDPMETVEGQRVSVSATKLRMAESEVRTRYQAIAAELPLRLAWREGAAA